MGYGETQGLKHFKTLGIYKNSTGSCRWYPAKLEGWSYNWCFTKIIDGVRIFNTYKYSVTTSSHQRVVRNMIPDSSSYPVIYADLGSRCLTNFNDRRLKGYLETLLDEQISLELKSKEPMSDEWLVEHFKSFNRLNEIESLKISQKDIELIQDAVFERRFNELNERHAMKLIKRQEMKEALTNLITDDVNSLVVGKVA